MSNIISVKELCGEYCIDENDVSQLASAIIARLKQSEQTVLDFEGVDTVLTAFFNGLMGKLFTEFDFETIKKLIIFSDLTQPIIREKFKKSLENAHAYYAAPKNVQTSIRKKINSIFTEIDVDE